MVCLRLPRSIFKHRRRKPGQTDRRKRAGNLRRWLCFVLPTSKGGKISKSKLAWSHNAAASFAGIGTGTAVESKKIKKKTNKKKRMDYLRRCTINSCWCMCETGSSCWCSCVTNNRKHKEERRKREEEEKRKELEKRKTKEEERKRKEEEENKRKEERRKEEEKRREQERNKKKHEKKEEEAGKHLQVVDQQPLGRNVMEDVREKFQLEQAPAPAPAVPLPPSPPPLREMTFDSAASGPQRLPPGPARELPLPGTIVGQDVYLKTALSYLSDDAVGIVGIYGGGGIGKTTLLKSINNRFCSRAGRTEFDHIAFVAVGKKANLVKLQRSIAYEIGLLLKEDDNEVSQAHALFNFLKGKHFLLLLDDVLEPLELSELGIPPPASDSSLRRKQKLILTTRLGDISGKMQAHKILILESLKWDDAWSLFQMKVGEEIIAADRRVKSLAMTLAKECSGLPLALVTIGLAMSAKKTPEEWQSTITLLKSMGFHETSGIEDELLPLLHVSYKNLPDKRLRECFLCYSLWPERYHVLKENAIKAWFGLGSMDQLDDMNKAFDLGNSMIENLKAASLLEPAEGSYRRLQMHEVIREMALWIASQRGSSKSKWLVSGGEVKSVDDWSTAERISLAFGAAEKLPEACFCPILQSLILRGNKRLVKIPGGLLPCLPALRFLDLSHTGIDNLPSEVGMLVNLQFLNLSFTKISTLPEEMQVLVQLKYLEMEGTSELKKIPPGMIANLEMLQGFNLYMSGYANWNWLSVRRHEGVTFEELVSLPRLRSVGFTVRNIPLLLRLFSMKRISVHSLTIRDLRGLISLHLLPALLRRSKMGSLRNLTLESSQGLKELVLGDDSDGGFRWSLSQLQVFNLVCLPQLERVVWRGTRPHSCLPNLRFLALFYCNSLKNITWTLQLPQLEELYIQNCNEMEQMISEDTSRRVSIEDEEAPLACFPKLKYMFLRDMKKLASICNQVLAFPALERMLVFNCKRLKQVPFGLKSAEKLRMIYGERSWWLNLVWEEPSLKSIFLPCFREIPLGCEPSMKALHVF